MIRYNYINRLVLSLYEKIPIIKFPLNVEEIINLIPNCKYMSYQEFAKINNCSIEDVILICDSKSGCTHYETENDRYLILCNQSLVYNNLGRQRWTCSHELGHILCKHHIKSYYDKLSENSLFANSDQEFEAEADYFASVLLAPFPLFKELDIQCSTDIRMIFGLSKEASQYRFSEYQKWITYHRKTSWENDLIRLYKSKSQHSIH